MERLFSEAKHIVEEGMRQKTPIEKLEKILQVRYAYKRGFCLNKATLARALNICPYEEVYGLCNMIKYFQNQSMAAEESKQKRSKN